MKFILQRTKGLLYDFQYELLRSKEYYDWWNSGKQDYDRTELEIKWEDEEIENPEEYCPVGSVEFCNSWFNNVFGKIAKPRNVPKELIKNVSSRRKIYFPDDFKDENWKKMFRGEKIYVKSMDTIKAEENGLYSKTDKALDKFILGNYQFSEEAEFLSEWRCFIYNNEIVDIKNYSGDPFIMPTKRQVKNKVEMFVNAPIAYTLDLAIAHNFGDMRGYNVEVVEVHDFFACGLYGFSDYKTYPLMLWRWFKEFTKGS